MDDLNQLGIPDSFVALYLDPGRVKPRQTRAVIAARYELSEDMAQQLFELARAWHFDLGLSEDEVLRRCRLGLLAEPAAFDAPEAAWIVRRLAELEAWADINWQAVDGAVGE